MSGDNFDFLELSSEILGRGNRIRFQARGGSMHPFIKDGDILEVESVNAECVTPGDVVFYRVGEEHMSTHRVIRKKSSDGKTTLVIKGDSNPSCEEGITLENILGRVVAVERNGRNIRFNRGLNRLVNVSYAHISHLSPYIYPLVGRVRRGIRYLLAELLRRI